MICRWLLLLPSLFELIVESEELLLMLDAESIYTVGLVMKLLFELSGVAVVGGLEIVVVLSFFLELEGELLFGESEGEVVLFEWLQLGQALEEGFIGLLQHLQLSC